MRPKIGDLFVLSTRIRIGSFRFPLSLTPHPTSPSPAQVHSNATTTNAAAAAAGAENVTQALISGDPQQQQLQRMSCYGAMANAEMPMPFSNAPPEASDSAAAAAAAATEAASSVRLPPSGAPDATSACFIEEAPPPYNPGFDPTTMTTTTATIEAESPLDDTSFEVAAAAAAVANVTLLQETLHECGICMVNTKDRAFDCGHLACSECADLLVECHICREKITGKRKIYL